MWRMQSIAPPYEATRCWPNDCPSLPCSWPFQSHPRGAQLRSSHEQHFAREFFGFAIEKPLRSPPHCRTAAFAQVPVTRRAVHCPSGFHAHTVFCLVVGRGSFTRAKFPIAPHPPRPHPRWPTRPRPQPSGVGNGETLMTVVAMELRSKVACARRRA